MNRFVWAYSESEGVANEVAAAAAEVARAASSEPVAIEIGFLRPAVQAAAKLLLKGPRGPDTTPEIAAEALSRAAKKSEPMAILVGATRNGRETASRLAAKLKVGCLSDAFKLSADAESIEAERSVYAGKVAAKVRCNYPAVVTIKVGSYSKLEALGPKVEELDIGDVAGTVRVLGRSVKERGSVDLKTAKVIVSAGRGVKKKEDLAMVEALAKEMGGALGCSRPISSDLGWLPEEHHIGLTGVTVKPDLYLAVGISGQLQHVAGMKDSKIVAAINTDKEAPIFQAADYGIVGDLYQVIPAIQRAFARRR